MDSRSVLVATVAVLIGYCAPAMAQNAANDARINVVPGEKLDSGLGALPHYRGKPQPAKGKESARGTSARLNPVPGEKLDSGLGQQPLYRSSSLVPVIVSTTNK
jgi:hypothetical protein